MGDEIVYVYGDINVYDGDIVLVNDNKTMIDGVDRSVESVIDVDDKVTALAETDIVQNKIANIVRSSKSFIGEFSNYATAYHNRRPKTDEAAEKYRDYIDIISVLTGKSIDKQHCRFTWEHVSNNSVNQHMLGVS